ncbi:hypothetical protein DWV63_01705 [Enterococcus durans]|nr:hypothetical protein DWV63_01705 [Enterococcus durans]
MFRFEELEKKTRNTLFVLLVFFLISEKPDFWTPFILESVAELIFRIIPRAWDKSKKHFCLIL